MDTPLIFISIPVPLGSVNNVEPDIRRILDKINKTASANHSLQKPFLTVLSFFPEVIDTQGCRKAAAPLAADRGCHQNDGGDDEGQCLIQLGGHSCQPA